MGLLGSRASVGSGQGCIEPLDASVVSGLLDVLPVDQVRELVVILIEDVRTRLDRIASFGEADLELLKREAHDLKSSCGNFGLVELANAAVAIEAACRTQCVDEAWELARALPVLAARGIAALQAVSRGPA